MIYRPEHITDRLALVPAQGTQESAAVLAVKVGQEREPLSQHEAEALYEVLGEALGR